jgi:hypothetical protein
LGRHQIQTRGREEQKKALIINKSKERVGRQGRNKETEKEDGNSIGKVQRN